MMNKPTVTPYVDLAMRTASGRYYGSEIPESDLAYALSPIIEFGGSLDDIKKALFYGRDLDLFRSNKCTGRKLDKAPAMFHNTELKGEMIFHGLLGIITEAVELGELLEATVIDKKPFDEVNLKEELGDIFWYMAMLAKTIGFTFEEVQDRNIAKLRARFPDKFSEQAANNRDLKKERNILEGDDDAN